MTKNLVQIIKDNPGCHVTVDNDWWQIDKIDPASDAAPNEDDMSYEAYAKWEEGNKLIASGDDFEAIGDGGYGSGNCYGGDVLQALAKIVGITVGSV